MEEAVKQVNIKDAGIDKEIEVIWLKSGTTKRQNCERGDCNNANHPTKKGEAKALRGHKEGTPH